MVERPIGQWQAQVSLERSDDGLPFFLQVARALSDDIRRGRLGRGTRLPSSRLLAAQLGLHRNTILAAYRELTSEGFIETRPGRGTFVTSDLPSLAHPPTSGPGRGPDTAFDLSGPEPRPLLAMPMGGGLLGMYGGLCDLRLLKTAPLARAYRRSLRKRDSLNYANAQGHPALRSELSAMLSAQRGLSVAPDQLLVTRGSQMAVHLAARALLRPGDRVAVEAFGYPPIWEALRLAGAVLVPIPVDRDGLDVAALERACQEHEIKAVYVTAHHQYPTTVRLSQGRRRALLTLARERRMAVLEDDYDHEYHYEGRPLMPLASDDLHGSVIYIGTLSKVLAPGLRIGYLSASEPLLRRARDLRLYTDRQGDHVTEGAVAELLADGELQRHLWRTRRAYRARRDCCVQLLRDHLGHVLSFEVPGGGMALWCGVQGVDPVAWQAAAITQGVAFQPGAPMAFASGPTPFARIGYACLTEAELERAVSRLVLAYEAVRCGG